jgi:hypothetical protein
MSRAAWLLVGSLGWVGCFEHQRAPMGLEDQEAYTVAAPTADRCAKYKRPEEGRGCRQMRETAVEWMRHLNVGDQICMESPFGEDPGRSCKARGAIVDSGADFFVFEIRDAHTDSVWFRYNQHRVRYASDAVVDQYVKERGYE